MPTPLSETTIAELETRIETYVRESVKAGNAWAEAKALYESLSDKEEVILASLKSKHFTLKTQAAKEEAAYQDPEWTIYLEGLSVARRAYYQSQVEYDNAKLKVDVLRSVMSTRREEISKFNAGRRTT